MKIETPNLEALVKGKQINEYQRSLAKRELLQLKNLAEDKEDKEEKGCDACRSKDWHSLDNCPVVGKYQE